MSDAKPKVDYYHYSNSNSQGALLRQTAAFPRHVDTEYFEIFDAYTDRLAQWDYDLYRKACDDMGCRLAQATDEQLKKFCQTVFKKDYLPEHVRVVYYYNVSSGYDCPRIDAIFRREQAKAEA